MKQNRHQKIAELVSRYEIETQEELAEKLKEVVLMLLVTRTSSSGASSTFLAPSKSVKPVFWTCCIGR